MSRAGKFSMVSRSVWRSAKFKSLPSDRARLLFFYFLTSDHQNGIGCFRLPDGYAIADLGWTLPEYHVAKGDVEGAGLIDTDPDTDEIYVERWMQNNPPSNKNHATGMRKLIFGIESDRLREKAEGDFLEVGPETAVETERPSAGHYDRLSNTRYLSGRG